MAGIDESTIYERIEDCQGTYEQPVKRLLRKPVPEKHCGALMIKPNVTIHERDLLRNPYLNRDYEFPKEDVE